MTSPARLGWLGGTFDPIHCGHLDVATAAHTALHLDEVRLVPVGRPSHRTTPTGSLEHRWAMVTLAARTQSWLSASDEEMRAVGPSYTADTLDRFESSHVATGVGLRSLYVITGADAFAHILSWKQASTLVNRCHFAVVSRPGHPVSALRNTLPTLAGRMIDASQCIEAATPSIFLVDAATAPVSSTVIRSRAAAREPLDGLVPANVAAYIDTHELYRGEA